MTSTKHSHESQCGSCVSIYITLHKYHLTVCNGKWSPCKQLNNLEDTQEGLARWALVGQCLVQPVGWHPLFMLCDYVSRLWVTNASGWFMSQSLRTIRAGIRLCGMRSPRPQGGATQNFWVGQIPTSISSGLPPALFPPSLPLKVGP